MYEFFLYMALLEFFKNKILNSPLILFRIFNKITRTTFSKQLRRLAPKGRKKPPELEAEKK